MLVRSEQERKIERGDGLGRQLDNLVAEEIFVKLVRYPV